MPASRWDPPPSPQKISHPHHPSSPATLSSSQSSFQHPQVLGELVQQVPVPGTSQFVCYYEGGGSDSTAVPILCSRAGCCAHGCCDDQSGTNNHSRHSHPPGSSSTGQHLLEHRLSGSSSDGITGPGPSGAWSVEVVVWLLVALGVSAVVLSVAALFVYLRNRRRRGREDFGSSLDGDHLSSYSTAAPSERAATTFGGPLGVGPPSTTLFASGLEKKYPLAFSDYNYGGGSGFPQMGQPPPRIYRPFFDGDRAFGASINEPPSWIGGQEGWGRNRNPQISNPKNAKISYNNTKPAQNERYVK